MASGFSFSGGQPRCFPFWQEFQKCYSTAGLPNRDCKAPIEDYLECLHRTKELARAREVQQHYAEKQTQQLQAQKEEQEVAATGIMALGLARREPEEKERAAQAAQSSS